MKKTLLVMLLIVLTGCNNSNDLYIDEVESIYNDNLVNYSEHYEIVCDSQVYYSFDIYNSIVDDQHERVIIGSNIGGDYKIYIDENQNAFYEDEDGTYYQFTFDSIPYTQLNFLSLLTETEQYNLDDLLSEDDVEYQNIDVILYSNIFRELLGLDVDSSVINVTYGFNYVDENKYISHGIIEIESPFDLYKNEVIQKCEIMYQINNVNEVVIDINPESVLYDENVFLSPLFHSDNFNIGMMTGIVYESEEYSMYEEEINMMHSYSGDKDHYLLSVNTDVEFEYTPPGDIQFEIIDMRGAILYESNFLDGSIFLRKGLYVVSLEFIGDIENIRPYKPLFATYVAYSDYLTLMGGEKQYLFQDTESIDLGYILLSELELYSVSDNLNFREVGQYESIYTFRNFGSTMYVTRYIEVLPFEEYDERYDVLDPIFEIVDYDNFFVTAHIDVQYVEQISDSIKVAIFDDKEMVDIKDYDPSQTEYKFLDLKDNVNYKIYVYAEYDNNPSHPFVIFRNDFITQSNPKIHLNEFLCETETDSIICDVDIDFSQSEYAEEDALIVEIIDGNGNYITNSTGRYSRFGFSELEPNTVYEVRLSKRYPSGNISLITSVGVVTKAIDYIIVTELVKEITIDSAKVSYILSTVDSITEEDNIFVELLLQENLIVRLELPTSSTSIEFIELLDNTEYTVRFYQNITSIYPNNYQTVYEFQFRTQQVPVFEYSFDNIFSTVNEISLDYITIINKPNEINNLRIEVYGSLIYNVNDFTIEERLQNISIVDSETNLNLTGLDESSAYTLIFSYDLLEDNIWVENKVIIDQIHTKNHGQAPSINIMYLHDSVEDFRINISENEGTDIELRYELYLDDVLINADLITWNDAEDITLTFDNLEYETEYMLKVYATYYIEYRSMDDEDSYFEYVEDILVYEETFIKIESDLVLYSK